MSRVHDAATSRLGKSRWAFAASCPVPGVVADLQHQGDVVGTGQGPQAGVRGVFGPTGRQARDQAGVARLTPGGGPDADRRPVAQIRLRQHVGQPMGQGEGVVVARGRGQFREAVAVVERPPCSLDGRRLQPRLPFREARPVGGQIPVHLLFGEAAESPVGGQVGV
jgi:hypothetical protein